MKLLIACVAAFLMNVGTAHASFSFPRISFPRIDITLPNPIAITDALHFTSYGFAAEQVVGLPICISSGVIIKMASVKRRLKNGEAWTIYANCVVPFSGPVLKRVLGKKKYWNAYPIDPAFHPRPDFPM